MAKELAPLCIYTIKHSRDLLKRRRGTFHENRRWTTARRLLERAQGDHQLLAVVFAQAEFTDDLVAWAYLTDIQIDNDGTNYTFSKLTRFEPPFPKKTDLFKRNGKRLSAEFIRPYAICQTPPFLD
jgi:hypothetical protein